MLKTVLPWIIGFTVLIFAAIQDRKSYTISLKLILVGMTSGLTLSIFLHGWIGLWGGLFGGVLGLVLGTVLSVFAHMGWGDTLLYGTIGTFFGPTVVYLTFGVTTLFLLVRLLPIVYHKQKVRIAVAPYMVLGTLVASVWAHWV